MADPTKTFMLLSELENIDVHEDRILDELLRRGAALEESERRSRMVTVAELRALRSGLQSLETAIDALQTGVARAEQAAEQGVTPKNGNGAPPPAVTTGAPPAAVTTAAAAPDPAAAQPPAPPPSFEELAARIREHDATGDQLRTILRERFAAPDEQAGDAVAPGPYAGPGAGAGGEAVSPVPPALAPPAPAPHAPPTYRITNPPTHGSSIRAFQTLLNRRLISWGVGLHVREDGVYGPASREAARRVARALGLDPADYAHGITPTAQMLMRTPSARTPAQLERARANRAWLAALRKHHPLGHVPARPPAHHDAQGHAPARAQAHHHAQGHAPARTGELEAAIRAHGGHYEAIIVREARAHGVPVSLVCAVMEMESRFRNVFGHDPVSNPVKSPRGGVLEVTEERYHEYLRHRNRGEGDQGVGPMQLTWHTLQDDADKLGGCWKVGPNIKVGVQLLASHIKASGTHAGLALYNGHGSDAEDYADAVLALERKWRGWLAGLSLAATPTHSTTKPHAAGGAGTLRVFKLTTVPMSGSDIKSFQGVLNHRLERWGLDLRIEEDGVYGPSTRTAFKRVARGLGLVTPGYAGGATPELRVLIRRPQRRTPRQIARARAARPWLTALRKHYAIGGETSAGGSAGASGHYPLSRRGKLIGTPFSGTHTIGNWQSDNAVDLGVPVGTKMLALDDGKVIKLSPHSQDGSRFAGDAITIQGDRGNAYFYKHGVASVTAGQRVRRGQVIGTSGSASGSPHLHLGIRKGDPRDIIGQRH